MKNSKIVQIASLPEATRIYVPRTNITYVIIGTALMDDNRLLPYTMDIAGHVKVIDPVKEEFIVILDRLLVGDEPKRFYDPKRDREPEKRKDGFVRCGVEVVKDPDDPSRYIIVKSETDREAPPQYVVGDAEQGWHFTKEPEDTDDGEKQE